MLLQAEDEQRVCKANTPAQATAGDFPQRRGRSQHTLLSISQCSHLNNGRALQSRVVTWIVCICHWLAQMLCGFGLAVKRGCKSLCDLHPHFEEPELGDEGMKPASI